MMMLSVMNMSVIHVSTIDNLYDDTMIVSVRLMCGNNVAMMMSGNMSMMSVDCATNSRHNVY